MFLASRALASVILLAKGPVPKPVFERGLRNIDRPLISEEIAIVVGHVVVRAGSAKLQERVFPVGQGIPACSAQPLRQGALLMLS